MSGHCRHDSQVGSCVLKQSSPFSFTSSLRPLSNYVYNSECYRLFFIIFFLKKQTFILFLIYLFIFSFLISHSVDNSSLDSTYVTTMTIKIKYYIKIKFQGKIKFSYHISLSLNYIFFYILLYIVSFGKLKKLVSINFSQFKYLNYCLFEFYFIRINFKLLISVFF